MNRILGYTVKNHVIGKYNEVTKLFHKILGNWKWTTLISSNSSDEEIYTKMLETYISKNQDINKKRASARVREMKELFDAIKFTAKGKILDYGCSDGVISEIVSKEFGLELYGTDIESWGLNPVMTKLDNFKPLINNKIPWSDKFNIITLLMVLHHIPPDNLKDILQNIKDHMGNDGILIVREHIKIDDLTEVLCHVEHLLRGVCNGLSYKNVKESYLDQPTNYQSKDEWISIFKKVGFNLILNTEPKGCTAYSYMVFSSSSSSS